MGLPLRPSSTPLASSSFIEIPSFEPETVASIAKRRMLRSAVLRRPHTTLGQYSREWKWKSTKEEKEDDGDEEEAERHAHSWVDSVEKSILKNSRAIKKIKEAYESTRSFRKKVEKDLWNAGKDNMLAHHDTLVSQGALMEEEELRNESGSPDEKKQRVSFSSYQLHPLRPGFSWPEPKITETPLCGACGGWGPARGSEKLFNKGQSLLKANRFEEAEALFKAALADPKKRKTEKMFQARVNLSLSQLAQGKAREAAGECEQALQELETDKISPRGKLVNGQEEADRNELSRKKSFVCLYNKGLAYAAAGMHSAAIKSFTEARRFDSSNMVALQARALSYRSLKCFREAIQDYSTIQESKSAEGEAMQLQDLDEEEEQQRKIRAQVDLLGKNVIPENEYGRPIPPMKNIDDAHNDPRIRKILRAPATKRSDEDIELLIAVMMKFNFFQNYINNPAFMTTFCTNVTYRRFGYEEVVFNRGDEADFVFVVWTGTVELTKNSDLDMIGVEIFNPAETKTEGMTIGIDEVMKGKSRGHFAKAGAHGALLLSISRENYLKAFRASQIERAEQDAQFLRTFFSSPRLDLFPRNSAWGKAGVLEDLVLNNMEFLSVPGKHVVCRQGDNSEALYFIRRGKCEVYRTPDLSSFGKYYGLLREIHAAVRKVDEDTMEQQQSNGKNKFLSRGGETADENILVGQLDLGDWFGGETVLKDGHVPYFYTIVTTEPSQLLLLKRSSLFHLQGRSLQILRDALSGWVPSLPRGFVKDNKYAQYKEKVLAEVLGSRKAMALRKKSEKTFV